VNSDKDEDTQEQKEIERAVRELEAISARAHKKAAEVRQRFESQQDSKKGFSKTEITFIVLALLIVAWLLFNLFSIQNGAISCEDLLTNSPNCSESGVTPDMDRLPENDGILPGQR
jgi:hypothetical protein